MDARTTAVFWRRIAFIRSDALTPRMAHATGTTKVAAKDAED
jgi:hypothetical protein